MQGLMQNNNVWLCRVDLEKDYEGQLTFPSMAAQTSYFLSTAVKSYNNVSFVRDPVDGETKNYLRLEAPVDQLHNCNYVMYKNGDSQKYYYAFIDRLEYKSPYVTWVYMSPDAFQNWQFDITYHKSFIDRQTPINIDERNTLSDTPAHGQLIERQSLTENFRGAYFAFCSTDITQDDPTESIPYSLKIGEFNIPCWTLFFTPLEAERMGEVLGHISNRGYGDRIMSAVYVPFVKDNNAIKTQHFNEYGGFNLATQCDPSNLKKEITMTINNIDGYGKELTYPYAKIMVQDLTTGQTIELAPEKFENGQIKFELQGTISETPCYRVIPKGYEGQYLAHNHALVTKCSTSLPIVNNLYAKYLMQNQDINTMSKINALSPLVAGTAAGTPVSMGLGAVSSLQTIASITMQETQATKLGNSVTSITDGAMERLVFENGIRISLYTMDRSHQIMCQNYWRMYGYPVKSLATPNIKTNDHFNYIKMVSPNIEGRNVPQNEMQIIKNMFEKGVTLWHNPVTMGKY